MNLYIKLSVCVPRLIPGRGFYAQISSEIISEFPGVTVHMDFISLFVFLRNGRVDRAIPEGQLFIVIDIEDFVSDQGKSYLP